MKYLIDKICINADQIVCAEYIPEHPDRSIDGKVWPSRCVITLTSIHPEATTDNLSLTDCPESDVVDLNGDEADRFWDYYIRDALTVVSP